MNSKLAIGAALIALSTMSFAQEQTPVESNWGQVSTKSRAEVRAELSMWQRAGLNQYEHDTADKLSADYQRRVETFARLMNGPEYVAEVERLEGNATRTAGTVDASTVTR